MDELCTTPPRNHCSFAEGQVFSGWLYHRAPIDSMPLSATVAGGAGMLISIVTMAIAPGTAIEMAIVVPAGLMMLVALAYDRHRRLRGERDWEKEIPEYVLRQISRNCSAATVQGLQVLKVTAPDQTLRFRHLELMMGRRQSPRGERKLPPAAKGRGPFDPATLMILISAWCSP